MEDRDIQHEIRAAFDSVNLIQVNAEDDETISRNITHLKIKMNDIDFVNGLTEEEFELISSLIKDK
jgi:hypothetical protein